MLGSSVMCKLTSTVFEYVKVRSRYEWQVSDNTRIDVPVESVSDSGFTIIFNIWATSKTVGV